MKMLFADVVIKSLEASSPTKLADTTYDVLASSWLTCDIRIREGL